MKRARAIFAKFDKDESSSIDKTELSAMLNELLADVQAQMHKGDFSGFVGDVLARGDKDHNRCDQRGAVVFR